MLALGYPGGPILDQLAAHGDPQAGPLRRAKNERQCPTISASAESRPRCSTICAAHPELQPEIDARQQALARGERTADALRQLSSRATLDLIASFQRSVVDDLVHAHASPPPNNSTRAPSSSPAASPPIANSAPPSNPKPRRRCIEVYFPSRALSTDNAAMIAAAAHPRFLNADFADSTLNAEPNLALA